MASSYSTHGTDKETRVVMQTFHVKHAGTRVVRGVMQICLSVSLAAVFMLAVAARSLSHAQQLPTLSTNAQVIEDLGRPPVFDAADPRSVLAFLLQQLPDEVRVYPTENYAYFNLAAAGVAWSGSLRFGPDERAKGLVELSIFKALTDWDETFDGIPRALLGAAEGVRVEAVDAFSVRVTQGARSVLFRLNDLSSVTPPAGLLLPEERFLGPIFDESAVRFWLVYNSRLKLFHYVLDESAPLSDTLQPVAGAERLSIGRRTGFAFYRDHQRERRILVGVYEPNSRLNTWLDGPFDQLPENFIKGEDLREAIIASDPEAKGQIDRLGHYLKEEGRYLIHPYMLYRKTSDLKRIDTCARQRLKRPDYALCFVIEPEATTLGPPPPAGRKR